MIQIAGEVWRGMVEHAERAYPFECCGILLGLCEEGGPRRVTRAMLADNVYDGDQRYYFTIDPRDQLRAEGEAHAAGLDVLGFFHSHPDRDVHFSPDDTENCWPGYSNVVISIREGRVADWAAFRVEVGEEQVGVEPMEVG
jgi:proteasome lid subunit RPN8/RPN11